MVMGPVSMPFIGLSVRRWAKTVQSTVMACGRDTSPNSAGGFTQREP